jgi:hypothetical protein
MSSIMSQFRKCHVFCCATVAACVFLLSASSAKATPYSDAVLADGPIAYYRLQETAGTLAANSAASGSALDGSTSTFSLPVSPYVKPQIGQPGPRPADTIGGQPLLGFESDNVGIRQTANTNAQVTVPDNSNLDIIGALTLEVWVRKNATQAIAGNNEGILGKFQGGGTTNERSYVLAATAPTSGTGAGTLQFIINSTGFSTGNLVYSPTGYTLPAGGDWVHLAAVYVPTVGITPGSMTVYVNGAVIGTPLTTGVPTAVHSGAADLWIGRQFGNPSPNGSASFEGLIDEAAVYNKALTAQDIAEHYQAAFVPEPATYVFAIFGLAATALGRWKQRG